MNYLYSAADAVTLNEQQLGGKAANLLWLTAHGYPVPNWWVIPAGAMDEMLRCDAKASQLMAQLSLQMPADQLETIAGKISARLARLPLPESLMNALAALDEEMFWAVRSSCSDEDARHASFAGQMDSFLFQRGQQQLVDAVKGVMMSTWSARAMAYRLRKGLALNAIHCSIIVQEMVEGEVSGVLFTAHPVSGSRQTMLISAGWGCGEGIVSGQCNTDEFSVPLEGSCFTQLLSQKTTAMVFDHKRGTGTLEVELDASQAAAPSLTAAQILALRDMGAAIARALRAPQDIEWTLKDNRLHLLQTRPITHLPKDSGCVSETLICDNANIQESYCGVTTPLTFSFARAAYATVYEQTLQLVGCSAKERDQRRAITDNMLSLVRGRVYYNIQNWYRALLLLPSFRMNKSDMEAMMGLEEPVDTIKDKQLSTREKIAALPAMLKMGARLVWAQFTLEPRIHQFLHNYTLVQAHVDRDNLHTLSPAELIGRLKYLDQHLLTRWTAPIVNDFYVARYNGKVQALLREVWPEQHQQIAADLLADEGQLISTEPTRHLLALSQYARQRPQLAALIQSDTRPHLLIRLKALDRHFYQQCLDYIERYGDRTIGELKLETITLRQDPRFLFDVLRSYLNTETVQAKPTEKLRGDAEERVFSHLLQTRGKRVLAHFKRHLSRLKRAIHHRETMRFTRTKMFALYRDIYLQLGHQLALEGVLISDRDIFWLTREEIYQGLDGTAVQTGLTALIAQRRAEYERYQQEEEPANRLSLTQTLFQQQTLHAAQPPSAANLTHLQGTGCYPGTVEAPVSLILSPEKAGNLAGTILCTVRTDPGWAPLFPGLGGLIVERGSTLSHSAIVAREMGIPAIVGVPGVTHQLQQGEVIRMNGANGKITRGIERGRGEYEPTVD
ncbi:phosphoenolpyruvate synthase [Kosakonia sp. SMBL-WEM22]|uniref:phosphoenolpyruvate synthase n=1 Tax=Kosakonia sp. SMBL-WEM22 TaxID=2725560 RepID=UPI00165A13C4|nr:phosphoenolpyruvate synthase [Kosakonia sp. SMBL-WEM22]QNQ21894.1 phosphoenolpyruvate synthase [Kosakonia sp. SMBL-WEM22]